VFRRPDEVSPVLSIPLTQCEIRRASRKTKKFSFELNVPSEKEDYCFATDTEKEMLSWIRLLRVIAEEGDSNKRLVSEERCFLSAIELKELRHSLCILKSLA